MRLPGPSSSPSSPLMPSSAAQIFLRSNGLLTRPLEKKDIKRRLLGHWGTCPGLNFVYAHTNALISDLEKAGESPQWMFITGVCLSLAAMSFRRLVTDVIARPRSPGRAVHPLP